MTSDADDLVDVLLAQLADVRRALDDLHEKPDAPERTVERGRLLVMQAEIVAALAAGSSGGRGHVN
jgi:hypothetical protein